MENLLSAHMTISQPMIWYDALRDITGAYMSHPYESLELKEIGNDHH